MFFALAIHLPLLEDTEPKEGREVESEAAAKKTRYDVKEGNEAGIASAFTQTTMVSPPISTNQIAQPFLA